MFFKGWHCRLRITTGDAVQLFGPTGNVGLYIPLPTALVIGPLSFQFPLPRGEELFMSLLLGRGFEVAFVGVVRRALAPQVVRLCFHCLTPMPEKSNSDEVSRIYSLSRKRDDPDELSLIYSVRQLVGSAQLESPTSLAEIYRRHMQGPTLNRRCSRSFVKFSLKILKTISCIFLPACLRKCASQKVLRLSKSSRSVRSCGGQVMPRKVTGLETYKQRDLHNVTSLECLTNAHAPSPTIPSSGEVRAEVHVVLFTQFISRPSAD